MILQASPEATGGAGTVMEHRYAATLLAALLLHESVPGLGGTLVPETVQFQRHGSPIDDLVVTARGAGASVTWYIAARRRPTFAASHPQTVTLFGSFLRQLDADLDAFETGRALLGLAVKGPHRPSELVAQLAGMAASQIDGASFRAATATRSQPLIDRLKHVDGLVTKALAELGRLRLDQGERDWTWTLLKSLRVVMTFLEESEQQAIDLTGRLRSLVAGGALEAADACRGRLNELAAQYAGTGARVGEAELRSALVGRVRLDAAPDTAALYAALAENERQLNVQTPRGLRGVAANAGAPNELLVDRHELRDALTAEMRAVSDATGTLVVHGEPDIGKSVLTLQVIDALRTEGAAVTVVGMQVPLRGDTPWQEVFGAHPVAPHRLLVLDGCEIIQEQGTLLLAAIASAAHAAGLGVVAVTRDDAFDAVRRALRADTATEPADFSVAPLPVEDLDQLIETFPVLSRLRERRSRWLLRRLGLVSLLLGAGEVRLRQGALSEAAIFDACWLGWVRRGELVKPGTSSPDAREQALLHVARRPLSLADPTPAPLDALPSLRADGLLLPYRSTRQYDEFPSDLVRDLATTRLLIGDPAAVLSATAAPRWTLRSARVACQAEIREAGPSAATVLLRQLETFEALAATYGERWAEVPWEALLTSGSTEDVLRDGASALYPDHGRRLTQLLRVALQRLCPDGWAHDPILIEPIVDWIVTHDPLTQSGANLPGAVREQADELTLAWLRGITISPAQLDIDTRAVRRRVGESILARRPDRGDLIEALALLGTDLDEAGRTQLRQVAADWPQRLAPAVDRPFASRALADADPSLLAELTEAYYLKQTDRSTRARDDGIRSHEQLSFRADWLRGPFWALLLADPPRGLDVIKRLLQHAVSRRAESTAARRGAAVPALVIDVLGLGQRRYVGDEEVYSYYRGNLLAPGPCVTALLASERLMDQLVGAGMPVRDVATMMLTRAEDLATVGLVVGFLVRHLDAVTDELDDFLAHPELWELELARTMHEQMGSHVADDPNTPGRALRSINFRDVAGRLATAALIRDDGAAQARLREVGDRLRNAGPGHTTYGAQIVELNASCLDADNFAAEALPQGTAYVFREPPRTAMALHAVRQQSIDVAMTYGLSNRYQLRLTPPFLAGEPNVTDSQQLSNDISHARQLAGRPSIDSQHSTEAATMVAGAAVRYAAATDATALTSDELTWAINRVLEASRNPPEGSHFTAEQKHSWAEDRSAAMAVPCLLLSSLHDDPIHVDHAAVGEALIALTTSRAHEVRDYTALALRQVWSAPCGPDPQRCRHRLAWAAVSAGTRDVVMTPWVNGWRHFTQLDLPLADSLRAADTDELVLDRLIPVLASSLAAAHTACAQSEVRPLRDALIDAFARVLINDTAEIGIIDDPEVILVADALLAHHPRDSEVVPRLLDGLQRSAEAVSGLLDALCRVATYNSVHRAELRRSWPQIFTLALPAAETAIRSQDRAWFWAALVPAPQPDSSDHDIDGTLHNARTGWPTAAELAPQIEAWIERAGGTWEPIVRLTGLLTASPRDQQLQIGLDWLRRLIAPRDRAASPGRPPVIGGRIVVEFLAALREATTLTGANRTQYDTILDALAANNVADARLLQERDE